MPKEWAENYDFFNYNIDQSSTVSTKDMPKVCQADTELPDEVLQIINSPMVLKPQEVKHAIHIDVDSKQTFGLKNLPPEWQLKFKEAGI